MAEDAHVLVERIKSLLRAGDFAAALPLIDQILAIRPNEVALLWHRARCLEALDRPAEALDAVERLLALKQDYGAAWVKRAELAAQVREEHPGYEAELRRALSLDPKLARAHYLLAGVESDEALVAAALARAIELDPNDPDPYLLRAQIARRGLTTLAEGEEGVKQFSGMVLSRPKLEAALADLTRAVALRPQESRPRLRRARVLHELGRFDEALAEFDRVAAALPADDPMRETVLQMRDDSAGGGAGERERMIALLEQGLEREDENKVKEAGEVMAEAMVRGAMAAMRSGRSVDEALAEFITEDPDDMAAISVAQNLFNLAHEPEPDLVPTPIGEFSKDQQEFAARAWKQLATLGFDLIGDFDPVHLRANLNRRTVVRAYRSTDSLIGAGSFRMAMPWPGWLVFLLLFLTRKWRHPEVIDLESEFDDGGFLVTTNTGSMSPFGYGETILTEALPLGTRPALVVQRHRERMAAYQSARPGTRALPVGSDGAAMLAFQRRLSAAKCSYRRSIGYVTDEELRQLLGGRFEVLAPKVRRKLAALAEMTGVQAA